ncbi:MAG: hypothetical protein E7231_09605 [Cellulosilyticum sp.]|nr:hypothetical protein [Cellulosilyticum sp.]
MNKPYRIIYYVLGICIFSIVMFCSLKYLNLSWVESNTSYVKVTINFLIPMEQDQLKEHIQLRGTRENQTAFNYSIKWLNKQVVELKFEEQNELKGQKIKLIIGAAPTQFKGLSKSATIPLQFKTDIELLEPTNKLLVSSTHAFVIAFNTPVSMQQINKYLQCETRFDIKPFEIATSAGESFTDDTRFLLTPKSALENGKNYILIIKAGMRAKCGTFLKQDQIIQLEVDQKPTINKTYPIDGDKWIGLYPRILLESKEEVAQVYAMINNQPLKGTLVDSKHAYFILDELLKPETAYELKFQVQVSSGEVSESKVIHFTTTTLEQKRFWMDIHLGKEKQICCYEGTKCIRKIPCQYTQNKNAYLLGTYYLQGKAEVYEDNSNYLGGNYWMIISDKLGIQGDLRDSYWQPSNQFNKAKNIIISDEDAAWLYGKIATDTMIIVRE